MKKKKNKNKKKQNWLILPGNLFYPRSSAEAEAGYWLPWL